MSGIKKFAIGIAVVCVVFMAITLVAVYVSSDSGALKDANDFLCGVQDDIGMKTHVHFGNYECSKKGK